MQAQLIPFTNVVFYEHLENSKGTFSYFLMVDMTCLGITLSVYRWTWAKMRVKYCKRGYYKVKPSNILTDTTSAGAKADLSCSSFHCSNR